MEHAMRIGFIDLGLMGQACTARLAECGHEVTGYDLQPEKIEVAAKTLVDLSTTETAATHAFAERLSRESAMGWIDASVSGGPEAAAAGMLAIMVGGVEADLLKVEPAIRDLAGALTHMEPVGAGQVTKMVNQSWS